MLNFFTIFVKNLNMLNKTEGYKKLLGEKKTNLKNLFFDDEYKDYSKKKKEKQKKLEQIAKFGVVGVIITICTLLYLPQLFGYNEFFINFAQYDINSDNFRIYQIFTAMWLHGGFIHLAANMVTLWFIGKTFQSLWGTKKFLILYIVSGLGGGLLSLFFTIIYDYPMMIGASGAIAGLLGALAILSPNSKILLFFIIPVKIKSLVMWLATISLILAVTNFNFGIGNAAHLGGLIIGYLITMYWKEKGDLYTTFI